MISWMSWKYYIGGGGFFMQSQLRLYHSKAARCRERIKCLKEIYTQDSQSPLYWWRTLTVAQPKHPLVDVHFVPSSRLCTYYGFSKSNSSDNSMSRKKYSHLLNAFYDWNCGMDRSSWRLGYSLSNESRKLGAAAGYTSFIIPYGIL